MRCAPMELALRSTGCGGAREEPVGLDDSLIITTHHHPDKKAQDGGA